MGVAVHGGFMGRGAEHRNEKGGPEGPPVQATTGAGEEIRTLDFNLGKSQIDVLCQYINGLYCLFKSEHDPKILKSDIFDPSVRHHRALMQSLAFELI